MKWTEAKVFTNNTTITNTWFIYEHIITKFDYPLKLINNQGGHFINKTIEILIVEIFYKPQNGHNLLRTLKGMVKQKAPTRCWRAF
jgi:hypothetical protein